MTVSHPLSPLSHEATVSIVVPAYNHGRYVAETIESVLAQDYPHIELIVIDDGSTDETASVLKRFENSATVVSQANAGQAATINRGWSQSRGEVVSYLSADDRLEPTAVSTAVAALRAHPDAVMVYGDYELIDPSSRFVRRVTAPDFDYTRMVRSIECAPGPGVFLRRWATEQVEGWNAGLRYAPDFDYWLRLALLGTFVRIPYVLAGLRVHPGSTSYAVASPERAEEMVSIMEAYFARPDLPPAAHAVHNESLSSAHLWSARAHIRASRFNAAARSIRRATLLSPTTAMSLRTARLIVNGIVNRGGHKLLWHLRNLSGRRSSPADPRP